MNKIYRVIWSKTKRSYVVVSEVAKRNGKCSSSLNKKLIAAFLTAGAVLSVTGSAWAAPVEPTGGYLVSGSQNEVDGGISQDQTVFGYNNSVSDFATTAWGYSNTVSGYVGTAWGSGNVAAGTYATAWGSGNESGQNDEDRQETIDLLKSFNPSAVHDNEVAGFGTSTTTWGVYNKAYGSRATAFGMDNKAYGINSTAWGSNTDSFGRDATTFGYMTRAVGDQSTAWGQQTIAYGANATTWGHFTLVKAFDGEEEAIDATAFGDSTWAAGSGATAFGSQTLARGGFSTAFGVGSQAIGDVSTAFGENSNALGDNSLAALGGTTGAISGYENHSFDDDIDPEGDTTGTHYIFTYKRAINAEGAAAIGYGSNAAKSYTYAIGKSAKAYAENSVAVGNEAAAGGVSSTVIGTGSKSGDTRLKYNSNLQGGASSVYGAYNTVKATAGVDFDGFAFTVLET